MKALGMYALTYISNYVNLICLHTKFMFINVGNNNIVFKYSGIRSLNFHSEYWKKFVE